MHEEKHKKEKHPLEHKKEQMIAKTPFLKVKSGKK